MGVKKKKRLCFRHRQNPWCYSSHLLWCEFLVTVLLVLQSVICKISYTLTKLEAINPNYLLCINLMELAAIKCLAVLLKKKKQTKQHIIPHCLSFSPDRQTVCIWSWYHEIYIYIYIHSLTYTLDIKTVFLCSP